MPKYDYTLSDADNTPCDKSHGGPDFFHLSPGRSESALGSGALAPPCHAAGPRYDVVLFDADNTLFDFDKAEHRALGRTLEHFGFSCDDHTRERYLSINGALWAAFDRGEVGRDWLVVERFAALQREMGGGHDPADMNAYYLARLAEGADLLPGAEELCRALAPHCTLAIITNGVASAQRGRFDRSTIKQFFPYLFISGEMGCQKPQKVFFEQVLARMGVTDPRRVLVVGDSLSADIQGAVNAGLDSVWYNPKELLPGDGPRPTYVMCRFPDICTLILD